MKNYSVKYKISNTPGISLSERVEVIQCLNQNEAKEILSRKYGVDKNRITIFRMTEI